MKIEVYTDGACSKNGRDGACASWAFYFPEHHSLSNAERVSGDTQTNQTLKFTLIQCILKIV
jgi:ribonuclease HI